MIKNKTITGRNSGVNEVSKLNLAKAQLAPNDNRIPVNAARLPRKKYSIAVMTKICFRLAPSVRKSTLSRMRWNLLISTEAIKTTIPVMMLKAAIKRITKPILFKISSSTLKTKPRSTMEMFGKFLTIAC